MLSLNSSSKVHEWPETAGIFLCRYASPPWRARSFHHILNKQKNPKTKLPPKAEEPLLHTVFSGFEVQAIVHRPYAT